MEGSYTPLINELEESGLFRILEKVKHRSIESGHLDDHLKLAAVVDTETTGLDLLNDEAIELAMVAFSYDMKGNIISVVDIYNELNEPSKSIQSDIARLTGIDNRLVKGKSFDKPKIETFLSKVDLLIAHNAAFDRPFCERISDVFREKPWACSATEIKWRDLGFEGTKLFYLLAEFKLFHDGHRALDDCFALLEILDKKPLKSMQTTMAILLQQARATRYHISINRNFKNKDKLRSNNYRWNSGNLRGKKGWFIEVNEASVSREIDFLVKTLDISMEDISITKTTAFDRFKI